MCVGEFAALLLTRRACLFSSSIPDLCKFPRGCLLLNQVGDGSHQTSDYRASALQSTVFFEQLARSQQQKAHFPQPQQPRPVPPPQQVPRYAAMPGNAGVLPPPGYHAGGPHAQQQRQLLPARLGGPQQPLPLYELQRNLFSSSRPVAPMGGGVAGGGGNGGGSPPSHQQASPSQMGAAPTGTADLAVTLRMMSDVVAAMRPGEAKRQQEQQQRDLKELLPLLMQQLQAQELLQECRRQEEHGQMQSGKPPGGVIAVAVSLQCLLGGRIIFPVLFSKAAAPDAAGIWHCCMVLLPMLMLRQGLIVLCYCQAATHDANGSSVSANV